MIIANHALTRISGSPEWVAREFSKAAQLYQVACNRRQGPDGPEQLADMVATIDAQISRISWVIEGSYGSEFAVYIDAQYTRNMAEARTPLQKARAAKWAGITAFTITQLQDYCDINAAGITRALKKAGYGKAEFDALNAKCAEIITDYFTGEE